MAKEKKAQTFSPSHLRLKKFPPALIFYFPSVLPCLKTGGGGGILSPDMLGLRNTKVYS